MMFSLFISVPMLLCGVAAGLTREYIFFPTTRTWNDAQTYCKQNYKDLATVTTAEENQRVYQLIGDADRAWIGLYRDTKSVDVWQWSDGSLSSFYLWNIGEPSSNGGNQNYCVLMEPGGWNDQYCYSGQTFVCYRFLILVNEEKTWEEAFEYCKSKHNGLASPVSETQDQFDLEISLAQTDSAWTRLRYLDGFWYSKHHVGDLNSLPSCPDPRYRCGARNAKTHVWENRDCNEKLPFLCI